MAELIKSRRVPVRLTARETAQEAVSDAAQSTQACGLLVEDPPGAARRPHHTHHLHHTHRLRTPKNRHLAKLAGLGVAAVALCCSIVTASLIEGSRPATTVAAVRPAVEITGGRALIPDPFDLDAPGFDGTDHPAKAEAGQDPVAAPRRPHGQIAEQAPPAPATLAPPATDGQEPGADQHTDAASQPMASETAGPAKPLSKTEVARRFYELLSSRPEEALDLLDDTLRLSTVPQLVGSGQGIHDADVVEVLERPDGSVQATVAMVLPDGHRMRVQQLLWFTDDTQPRISQAKVISAQHS